MINKFFFIGTIFFAMYSCTTDTTAAATNFDAEELAKLKTENRLLQTQLNEKDSSLNESIMLFNEIEENLAKINLKENEIRFRSKDIELAEDGKQWILQEIQDINLLREANQKKIKSLNAQLKTSGGKISEMEKLISGLNSKIEIQDQEIEMLRTELSDLDKEYVELLEAYQESTSLAAETIIELNTAYYAYGSFKELESNGVLSKEGGFIGIGKKTELDENFNEDYFTKVDITRINEIKMSGGKKVKLISDHPSSSYSIETTGNSHVLTIKDARKFWKVSKYLIAETK